MVKLDGVDDFKKGLRIGVFDIESTGLNADFGYIMCVSVLDPATMKIETIRIDDDRNPDKNSDKWVVREAVKMLDRYDLLVGWYSERFDVPMINTRAILHNLKPLDNNFRRDLWYTAKFRMKLRNNRLATVGGYLFKKTLKDAITPSVWNSAIRGEKKALNYVVHHCEKDLYETLRVYKRLLPLIPKRLRKK